jgi:hypothetical protein
LPATFSVVICNKICASGV